MTREEAIKWLKDHHSIDLNTQDDEAHRMAIEALEQKPCEDAVSRAEVLNLVRLNAFHAKSQIKAIENMPSVTPQEQFKPMVEIDLYSVIKQRYIEREVLDKIRAEIEQNAYPIVHGVNNHEKGMTLYGVLQIIDKYKAESEEYVNFADDLIPIMNEAESEDKG